MTARTLSNVKGKAAVKTEEVADLAMASATMIAGGIGVFFVGLMTTLAEASGAIKDALNWVKPVGPLSGKTGVAIAIWLISWFVLSTVMKGKESNITRAFTITLALIVGGLLLTFPPLFALFAAE